jgi:hypothetical protein
MPDALDQATVDANLKPSKVARARRLALCSLALLALSTMAACPWPTGLPENPAETEGFDGVYVNCENANRLVCSDLLSPADYRDCLDAAGANYWNEKSVAPDDCSYSGADTTDGYDTDGYGCPDPYAPPMGQVCIGENNPTDFPAAFQAMTLAAFKNEIDTTMAADIRALCTNECEKLNYYPVGAYPQWDPNCEDANWTGLALATAWQPSDGFNCKQSISNIAPGYNGGDINWGTTGSPVYLPLACGLYGTCAHYFAANIVPFIDPAHASVPIDLHDRKADYESQATSATTLALNMPGGSGAGIDDTAPLFGLAEWSRTSPSSSTGLTCTNATCPFYLGNLAAWNHTSTWDVRLYATSTAYYPKSISNVDISLVRSAMGIERMSNGRLAFPISALEFLVSFDIDSCPTCSDFGNGHYSFMIKNSTVVFGTRGSSGITLDYSFPVNLGGTASLHIVTTNVEAPPVASTLTTSSVACNRPGGYLLDLSWSTSTDPDSDLDVLHWIADGKWRSSRTILPVGTHSVRLEVTDVRGAVRRTAAKTLVVTSGAACP